VTGEVIPAELYMTEFTQAHFERILSGVDLVEAAQPASSARALSNILVVTESDRRELRAGGVVARIAQLSGEGNDGQAILASQFVSPEAVAALARDDLVGFLGARAQAMFEGASRLMA
jgi:hypothetical protein